MPATSDSGATFAAYLAEKRHVIEAYIEAHVPVPLPEELTAADLDRYLYAPLARFTASGGKRTRPALCLLGCEAVGGTDTSALSCAAAIEDFQSAALIHDDIADEGELRRGQPCVYLSEGTGIAINVGDLALVTVTAKILRDETLKPAVRMRVLEELVSMQERTLEGQALDLGWVRDGRWDVSTRDYLCMASHKTAFYSAATPLSVGAICGNGTDEQIEALGSFGMDAGLAFQLKDDLLNLVGDADAQGKDFRSDITEGKRTMIVTRAIEHLAGTEREELVSILSSHVTDTATLRRGVELMEMSGAIAAVCEYAHSLAQSAKNDLTGIKLVGDTHQVLESMADFFVERTE